MFQLPIILLLISALIFGSSGCSKKELPPEKPVIVERTDDIAVVSLKAPGFDKLSLTDKRIAYHLVKAAIAGRNLAYDQTHRNGLEIRNLLEEILVHPHGIPWETLEKISSFLKKFWTYTGQYETITSRKFVPEFDYKDLLTAADSAFSHGADFGIKNINQLHEKIASLQQTLFDPNYEPILTNKSPKAPEDILTGSAVNNYSNITLKEADSFKEMYPLNSRLVKDEQGIHEEVYRAGNQNTPPGKMANTVAKVIDELDQARLLAAPSQRQVLTHLITYLETGDAEEFRKTNIAWVKDHSPVDFSIGFIEVYRDPRGQKGLFEGVVYFVDSSKTKLMEKLAQHSEEFEALAPWDSAYKKTKPTPLVGKAVNLLVGTGDGGPICAGGINLPNDESVREKYGSKSVILSNVENGFDLVYGNATVNEFAENDRVVKQWEEWGDITSFLMTAMHEIIGHGSGKVSAEFDGNPAIALKEYASTLEEARADLVALYFIIHPKSRELGIVPDEACGEAAYRHYVRNDLVNLYWVNDLPRFEEDHDRGHHMIVEYLRRVTGAVDAVRKDGKLYLVVNDLEKAQQGVGELLGKLMRIKATGDYQGAKDLIETYGVGLNTEWRDEIRERMKALDLPKQVAFIMPELTLESLPMGRVKDVKISYPRDFVVQMLQYSGKIPKQ
jgi:dipeptidyl-peptidase-3